MKFEFKTVNVSIKNVQNLRVPLRFVSQQLLIVYLIIKFIELQIKNNS